MSSPEAGDRRGGAAPPNEAESSSKDHVARLLERIRQQSPPDSRYDVRGEINHGGMGAILQVWEEGLRRPLAMKIIRPRTTGQAPSAVDPAVLLRFLEEAQVTAQLAHPGVVPVHDLGVDSQGRLYFTMRLVEGHDFEQMFELVRQGAEGFSLARALSDLLKACETMAYAHSCGIIHRDLKPANIMTGKFGQVYVMDWGLAKLRGRDTAPASSPGGAPPVVSDRQELGADSSLHTHQGAIVGTVFYMSPEQALGGELDARSDVYAMGAILYTLLAGRPPYMPPGARAKLGDVHLAILRGPPTPISTIAPSASPELVAVCEKAMARDPEARYPDMQAMAKDLRAFLEGRVVEAFGANEWIRFRKWVGRNRGTAAALAALLVAVLGGTGAAAWIEKRGREVEAERNARILGLADSKKLRALEELQVKLWPAGPESAPALARWVEDAQRLQQRAGYHHETLAMLEREGGSGEDDAWLREQISGLVGQLDTFPTLTAQVTRRRDLAAQLEPLTVSGAAAREAWTRAIEDIGASEVYRHLRLTPQVGLLPLGRDPASGLWEFWLVASGERPVRVEGGGALTPEAGVVLVLLPGGTTAIGSLPVELPAGAQPKSWDDLKRMAPDFGQPFHDHWRDSKHQDEGFFESIALDPFFISKYELTQAQYTRIIGANPSQHHDPATLGGPTHPVETVSWNDASMVLLRLGLELPTEAQWEYACRAGSTTPFSSGERFDSLQGHANILDKTFASTGNATDRPPTLEVEDGFVCHAPVGSFLPNAFGLHDMHGNVWEWCRDRYLIDAAPRPGDGLRDDGKEGLEGTLRGGSWFTDAVTCRSANRFNYDRNNTDGDVGLRPVRRVTP
jgi:formylglycine-generating enzyme required for sulfatase activity